MVFRTYSIGVSENKVKKLVIILWFNKNHIHCTKFNRQIAVKINKYVKLQGLR